MRRAQFRASALALVFVASLCHTDADASRDGKQFDPGTRMTQRADGAPAQLDQLERWLGAWDVRYEAHDDSGRVHVASGHALVTFMNRGHALMERFHAEDFDGAGHALSTLAFVAYNSTNATWGFGEANGFTEHITVHTGAANGDELTLYDAARRRGGATITHSRLRLRSVDGDHYELVREESQNRSEDWKVKVVKTYTRRDASPTAFDASSDYGNAAPGMPPEAREFDFVVGEWSLQHDMTLPSGQDISFPTNGTAIHALDGHAIMEFNWNDVDPSLPDAATTIVRLYNRQMRRWECMYLTNRFNNILYFGGVREGDRIVLHQFNANAADSPISYWTFHDMEADSYGWYANTSRDRGGHFAKTWIIAGTRKAPLKQ